MRLQEALSQIADIHQQMARTRVFRGYRAATTAFTGVLALAAAIVQATASDDPASRPVQYVLTWVGVAMAGLVVVGTEIVQRYRRSESPLDRELTIAAIEQFLPCLITGGLVTVVICEFSANTIWMLPGLWSLFFAMGLLASRPLLPGPIRYIAWFYLLCGMSCLSLGPMAISPWTMGLPFGIGQLAAAVLLHWKLERNHDTP